MRLLLDECVPRKFKDLLPGHDVSTAREMGWAALRNGELLELLRRQGFDAFITVDQNVEYQQNIKTSGIAVLVLVARSNRLKDLAVLAPAALERLRTAKAGSVERVTYPT